MRPLREIADNPAVTVRSLREGALMGYLTLRRKVCTFMVTLDGRLEHASVAPMDGSTLNWNDMGEVKAIVWKDDEEAVQIYPRKGAYVNAVPNCVHLWRDTKNPVYGMNKTN